MKPFSFLLLISLFFVSCKNQLTDHDIILKIGDFEVTNYTLHKKVEKIFPDPKTKNKESLEKFVTDFIDSYYIVADAYHKRYDTLEHIQTKLKHSIDYAMAGYQGPMYKKLIDSQLNDAIKITPDKIEKRSKLYYFDIISIANKEEFLKLVNNDTILENATEFVRLKQLANEEISLNCSSTTMQWPFSAFDQFADQFLAMEEGQVSKLITFGTGSFYFYLDHTEQIEVTPEEEQNLKQELRRLAEKQLSEEIDQTMLAAGNPEINDNSVHELVGFLKDGNKLERFPRNLPLMNYTLDGVRKELYLFSYNEPVSCYPMWISVDNEESLRKALIEFYYVDYLVNEAHKLNLFNDALFKLDCKSLLNSAVYYEYIDREIRQTISIDSSEVADYYIKNQGSYSIPEYITFNCYIFEDEVTARNNWYAITDFYSKNHYKMIMKSKHLYNLLYTLPDYKINTNDPAIISNVKQRLLSLQTGELSNPLPFKDKYALFFRTGEEGQTFQELDEYLYRNIEGYLTERQADKLLKQRINELKEKYPVETNKIRIRHL